MNSGIIGHGAKLDLLNKVIISGGVHHGFLFSGPEGVGKYSIARSFANDLVNDIQECQWKVNVNDRLDSDVSIIVPEKVEKKGKVLIKDIGTEKIKKISNALALAPDKSARVLIIDDAHRMTINAQNALLKTLEEPRNDRYVILVTHSSDQLLQTIQSRCFHLQFGTVDPKELNKMYNSNKYIDDINGRPGYLKRMHTDEEFRETVQYARTQLQGLSQKKLHERLQLAKELSKKDDEYLQIFFYVWIYRIWTAAHKTKKFHLVKVADKIEQLLRVLQSTNVNKQLIIEDLLIHIV